MTFFDSLKTFWNNHIRSRLNSRAALFAVVVLCILSLLLQYFRRDDAVSIATIAGAVVVPFQEGINAVGGFVFDTEQKRKDLNSAKERIEELEKENESLKLQNELNGQLVKENEDLRRLLRAKDRIKDYEILEASVIGADGTGILKRFTIDRGSLDGIKKDMNVINGEGLVGYVSQVGLNYAIVTCIIEDGINVSAMTKNNRKNCIVTGSLELMEKGELNLENALSSIDFDTDSTLVTSDISDRYLPGLLIGYVTEHQIDPGELTISGKVKTAVDFSDIREVLVITTMKEKPED